METCEPHMYGSEETFVNGESNKPLVFLMNGLRPS